MGQKLHETKVKMSQPKVNTTQMIILGVLMVWFIIKNITEFYAISFMWDTIITIGFYVVIMLLSNQKGNIEDLVKSLIKLIVEPGTNEEKIVKLQNLLVAICQELNIYYEKEKEKLYDFLNQTDMDLKTQTKEEILAELRAEGLL